jgi:hypothetical protein
VSNTVKGTKLKWVFTFFAVLSFAIFIFLRLQKLKLTLVSFFGYVALIVIFSFCIGVLVLSYLPILNGQKRISVSDIYRPKLPKDFFTQFKNPELIPIGVSMVTNSIKFLSRKKQGMHSLAIGATGSGKTSLMKVRIKHAITHNESLIIIDPKGHHKDILEVKEMMKSLGKDESKFHLFSIVDPDNSLSFNPIKYGTAIQKKDCVLSGLNLTHEYYGSQAANFLSVLIPTINKLNDYCTKESDLIPVTIHTINAALSNKEFLDMILKRVYLIPDTGLSQRLVLNLNSIKNIKDADLSGLKAQINDLDNLEFGWLLSPHLVPEKRELDLYKVLKEGGIAYFQLSVNGYENSVAAIGKLLIQNLKSLSSQIQTGDLEPIRSGSVHIDEFGAFAQSNFDKFLKICRDSNLGIHMYTQGLADLARINKEFEDQVAGNNVTTFIFRLNVAAEVEKLVSSAGTIDGVEQSYQVESGLLGVIRTGSGNQRLTKQTMIDFDVIKNLEVGQAVVIERSPLKTDLVQIVDPALLV